MHAHLHISHTSHTHTPTHYTPKQHHSLTHTYHTSFHTCSHCCEVRLSSATVSCTVTDGTSSASFLTSSLRACTSANVSRVSSISAKILDTSSLSGGEMEDCTESRWWAILTCNMSLGLREVLQTSTYLSRQLIVAVP